MSVVNARRRNHGPGVDVSNDADDVASTDELLGNRGGAHPIAAVIAKENLYARGLVGRAGVQLLERELDAAPVHRAVLLGPRSGGAKHDRSTRHRAAREDERRDNTGGERAREHQFQSSRRSSVVAALEDEKGEAAQPAAAAALSRSFALRGAPCRSPGSD